MLKFTHGSPDEMQVWIACGIAAYLVVFPLVVVLAAVWGEVLYRTRHDGSSGPKGLDPASTPSLAHQREVVTPVSAPREPVAGPAA